MNMRAVALMFVMVAGCSSTTQEAPFLVSVEGPAKPCAIAVGGNAVTTDQLLDIARREVSKGKAARVMGGNETPYRCIGGVIYTLQRAGFTKVEFVSDAPATP